MINDGNIVKLEMCSFDGYLLVILIDNAHTLDNVTSLIFFRSIFLRKLTTRNPFTKQISQSTGNIDGKERSSKAAFQKFHLRRFRFSRRGPALFPLDGWLWRKNCK